VNSHDFPAYMRVTTGLGAMDVAVPPAVGRVRGRTATQAAPLPGPVAERWSGTAEGARRSRARSERGLGPRWSGRDGVDWDEVDRRHALRYETDQDDTAELMIGRAAAGRYETGRSPADPDGSDRYRGSRQWSDREQFAAPDDGSRFRPGTHRGSVPVSLRAPRGVASAPSSAGSAALYPAEALSTQPVMDDPTPLFTATEYVAIGDSPLYQFVAEFIATGDDLISSVAVAPAPVAPTPVRPAPVAPAAALASVRSAPVVVRSLAVGPGADADFPGGRHRDGWRVAGHRSAAESGRRSDGRAPRHRAA